MCYFICYLSWSNYHFGCKISTVRIIENQKLQMGMKKLTMLYQGLKGKLRHEQRKKPVLQRRLFKVDHATGIDVLNA